MDVKEALELAKTKRKTFDTCFEYQEFYVFSKKDAIDSSFAVHKITKKVVPFNPMLVSKKDLQNRKKIII